MILELRVLLCAFTCHPEGGSGLGGGEDILGWNLVKQIARSHRVWVLTHPSNRAGIEEELRRSPLPNVTFDYVRLPAALEALQNYAGGIQFYSYLWQWRAYFVARQLHRRLHFDLFHHITYANDWMASFIGALLPVAYVRGPGGGSHRTPAGFLSEYTPLQRFWERVRIAGQWLFKHDPFFILGHRRARALLVCNREAMNALPMVWQHKAEFFPVNGVDDDALAATAPSNAGNRFRVLSVGKLIRLKGFALTIRAFQKLASQHPDAEMEIIGEGPDRTYLQGIIQAIKLEGRVRLTDWMPHVQVLEAMRTCDVFVFGSVRDGGGAVIVEAMAAGKPVVCLDVAGPSLHVTHECGIKIPAHSPAQAVEAMASALERLYRDESLRLRLGQSARQRAEQFYSWDRLGDRLNEIYTRALIR